ncbi:hypothetical protein Tco_1301364 [Tanacetum coccineum]
MVKNKGLIADAYEWDEEEVSSDDNKMIEVKVLMTLAEDNDAVSKEGARNNEWVKIFMRKKNILGVDQLTEDPSSSGQKDLVCEKSSANDTKVSIHGVEKPLLSESEGFIMPNHDTVCITLLPSLKKLDGVEPVSGPKTIKSILKLRSAFKAEALKGVIINEPSSAPAKGKKSTSASKVNSAPAAFRVFNTKRQQSEETYHITFNESPDAIKFIKPLVDNINIAKSERYPPDEYLHPYESSQRYQTNINEVSFIEPYESPEPVVLEIEVSSDQNG